MTMLSTGALSASNLRPSCFCMSVKMEDEDQSLIAAANHNGGRDNITVLIVGFPLGIERRKPRRT